MQVPFAARLTLGYRAATTAAEPAAAVAAEDAAVAVAVAVAADKLYLCGIDGGGAKQTGRP